MELFLLWEVEGVAELVILVLREVEGVVELVTLWEVEGVVERLSREASREAEGVVKLIPVWDANIQGQESHNPFQVEVLTSPPTPQ